MNFVDVILIPMFLAHKPKTYFSSLKQMEIYIKKGTECIASVLSNSIVAQVYPSFLKLSARTFHPFLSHSLLATLPAYYPLLGIILSLIPSVQQGNKNGSY
jgi:hypothetical protein